MIRHGVRGRWRPSPERIGTSPSGRRIARFSAWRVCIGSGSPKPELGICINDAAQGFGFGRQAVETVMAWAGRIWA